MREWIRIDFEMDKLESGNTRNDLRFKASKTETNRQERLFNVASSVTIVEFLNAMAVASKK